MTDIDTVLERLVTDAAFRGQLGSDPAAALAGYDLTADDLELLASSLDDTDPGQRGVEQRTSKSAVLGLLASLSGGGGGGTGQLQDPPRLDGASKDTAYFGNAAPGGESEAIDYGKIEGLKGESATGDVPDDSTEIKLPGRPKHPDVVSGAAVGAAPGGETEAAFTKFDDIKGEATDAPDDGTEIRKVSGQKKYNNIVLKRGADTSRAAAGEEFAPADPGDEPSTAFKQGWPVKWQGANVAPGDEAPPAGGDDSADGASAWPKKIEVGSIKAGDTSAAGDFDGDARQDLADVGRSAQPEDFLTIEDE